MTSVCGDPGVSVASLLRIHTWDIGVSVAPAPDGSEAPRGRAPLSRLVFRVPVAGLQYCIDRGVVPPQLLRVSPDVIPVTPVLVTQVRCVAVSLRLSRSV